MHPIPPNRLGTALPRWCVFSLSLLSLSNFATAEASSPPDFAQQVQPLLEKHCYACHDATSRKGGLALVSKEQALLGGDSGEPLYAAHEPERSALLRVVQEPDTSKRMPLGKEPLAPEEIETLREWIAAGADWGAAGVDPATSATPDHWAFHAPEVSEVPAPAAVEWVRNPLDAFVAAKLEAAQLAPSPEADRFTLIRRLSLDLTGLPPAPEAIEAFINDDLPNAYERLVERLLESPHYGERRALDWLDVARYADTNGYEKDRARSIWPYRDWVINAFNSNKPFDRFVVEQIAGDLLPNATQDQRIATGFLRNSMLNEEGGVDVEEFRYEAMVDRMNTVSTAFLGLTMSCAQCHTHKYDPITQREYFQFMAFLNNTNDVTMPVKTPELTRQRMEGEAKIAALEAALEEKFPLDEYIVETAAQMPTAPQSAAAGALEVTPEGVVVSRAEAERDTYIFLLEGVEHEITALQLDVLPDTAQPKGGPGLADTGNFVLSEISLAKVGERGEEALSFARAEADHAQQNFAVEQAIDGKPETGWSVDGAEGGIAQPRKATFHLKRPVRLAPGEKLQVKLEQQHGGRHLLGRFRCSLITRHFPPSDVPEPERRAAHLAKKIEAWEAREKEDAHIWTPLNAVEYQSKNHATFEKMDDGSLLLTGDIPNTDTYELGFFTDLEGITAIRLEVLPDPSLPGGGPGRGVIMTPHEGDFLLSEIAASIAPWNARDDMAALTLQNATQDFAASRREAALALDGKMDTGWSIAGAEGQAHRAVFELAAPAGHAGGAVLRLKLDQYYVHQHTIGRLRVSVTTSPLPVRASAAPAQIEAILAAGPAQRTPAQAEALKQHFLSIAPELAVEHEQIAALREALPTYPTTLVLEEREDARVTRIHHRGKFLSPREAVEPGVPAVLHPFPESVPRNRLTFAAWLTDEANALLARVTMNRLWQSFFGRGLVATVEDFGTRGDAPTHPDLLDWLALEFMRRDWNLKDMVRLIVTSNTYRQSSRVSPELVERDPYNQLLARGPRFRVDAEIVRDIALASSGQLSRKTAGPSVYPPMPKGFLTLTFGGGGAWPESQGEDRYRRGLYTYIKRTMPYPTSAIFDAPARDVTCVRRVRSNTPLQALTMLNDDIFMEAAGAMAARVLHEAPATFEQRLRYAFLLAVSRAPDAVESAALKEYYENQHARLRETGAAPALRLAAEPSEPAEAVEQHVWTLICRALLNLDETITKS